MSTEPIESGIADWYEATELRRRFNVDLGNRAAGMKNLTTPRTLADCQWTSGYPQARISRRDRIGGVLLAVAMGLAAAALMVWRLSA